MTTPSIEKRVFAPNNNKECAEHGCKPDESTIRTLVSNEYVTIYAKCLVCGDEFVCGTMNMRGLDKLVLHKSDEPGTDVLDHSRLTEVWNNKLHEYAHGGRLANGKEVLECHIAMIEEAARQIMQRLPGSKP